MYNTCEVIDLRQKRSAPAGKAKSKTSKPPAKKQSTKKPNTSKKRKNSSVIKKVLLSFFIAIAFTVVATGGIIYALTLPLFDPTKLLQPPTLPTVVYDRYGHVAFTIEPTGVRRVALSDIPKALQDGLIATEDVRFYQNHGFDIRSIFRSVVNDVVHRNQLQGASTITGQLAKIEFLTDNGSLKYKLEQLILSIEIDRYFSKNQILDMYFNTVDFNGATPGIENAAQIYFQKNVNQLNLVQCALLAGLPQAPTEYDPFMHPHAALARRNIVLQQMAKYGYLSESKAQWAQKQPLELASTPGVVADGVPAAYAWYRDYLYQEANQIGIGATSLTQGGLKVYTNLDPQLQQAAYDQFSNNAYFPPNMSGNEAQGGAAFMNPANGGILALIGSRPNTYQVEGFNYATQTERSPGSSIKPLVVYGPAIETGKYNGDSLLYDGPLDINGYQPQDWAWHPTVNNQVTMRDALKESWNIPAVWLLDQIGISTGLDFAQKAGLTFESRDFEHLDVALGDIHPGTNPLQMAEAYSSFDNNGSRIPAHAIEKIVNSNDDTIYQASEVPIPVMRTSTAATMVGLLRNNVVNGIAQLASVSGHEIAGKTGSVAYVSPSWSSSQGDSDLWFTGFSPHVVGAIWEGFPTPSVNAYVPNWVGGSALPAKLFSVIMTQGLAGKQGGSFISPVNVSTAPVVTPSIQGMIGSYQVSQQGVVLSWDPVSDANVYYLVFRGAQGNTNLVYNQSIGNTTKTTYTNVLYVPGTYTYQVAAFDQSTHALVGKSPVISVMISRHRR